MAKKFILTVLGLLVVVGGLVGVKVLQFQTMFAQSAQAAAPPESVATSEVSETTLSPTLDAVGSVVSYQGVTLNAEITGTIRRIAFDSGASVQVGAVLVELDTSVERAQLEAASASRDLASINLESGRSLVQSGAIPTSQWVALEAQAKQAAAEVARLNALIAKKTIRAPFSGTTGMRLVNLGQLVGAGDAIVTLQSIDPVYVDFSLPQQRLSQLTTGSKVSVATDAFPDKVFEGELSAINPVLDQATRSLRLRATLKNPEAQLHPGMFAKVQVALPSQEKALLVPSTAVMFAPYGDSVFVVDNKDPQKPTVQQKFVRLGTAQGDFVVVLDGLKAKDTVVTTGAFKLRNGASIVINNELKPEPSLKPNPTDT
jgi:membrane fusion protein (multidrug efflux system)